MYLRNSNGVTADFSLEFSDDRDDRQRYYRNHAGTCTPTSTCIAKFTPALPSPILTKNDYDACGQSMDKIPTMMHCNEMSKPQTLWGSLHTS